MYSEPYPLPHGWVKQFDPSSQAPYYVDTKASPPRSIWTHPYEDSQYLSEHPEVREKVSNRNHDGLQPPSFEDATRRHSLPGQSSSGRANAAGAFSDPEIPRQGKHKRGFIGKLKDKMIGTKEEREATKLREEEHRRQMLESRRQQTMYPSQGMYPAPVGYGGNRMGGGMFGGGSSSMGGMGMGGRRAGGLGGGMALPLIGGLAGGLLLGDMLDGGFGGGDFGGGDFGGGDFGGGDFGGGGF